MQPLLSQRPRRYHNRYVRTLSFCAIAHPSLQVCSCCTYHSRGLQRHVPPSGAQKVSSRASTAIHREYACTSLSLPLTYNTNRGRNSWLQQLGIYLAALLLMKLFVLALFAVALDTVLLPLAGWILNWMQAWSQVVFSMAIFPLLMNILQVCGFPSERLMGADGECDSSVSLIR